MHTDRPTACSELPTSYFLLLTCCCLLLTTYCLPNNAFPADAPFISPSNWGGTGLMEVPTARVMSENSMRFGAGQVTPYRYFYGAVSPLKGLEIGGRITEALDVPSGLQDQDNFKDKAIDLKYQFVPEGKYMPALAMGIMDPHGTRVYPSQYIVASKQIYPFDFSIGFGNGRFGTKPLTDKEADINVEIFTDTKDWIKDSQFFGGIQFAPSDKFAFMLEYSPIEYHKQTTDPAQKIFFTDPVPSQFNVGFRYKPTKWAEIDITYQRGNQIGLSLSTLFDIGKPMIPLYNRPYMESIFDRQNPLEKRLTTALYHSGFSDIYVDSRGNELWIEAQNEKYFYNTKAIGVIFTVLNTLEIEESTRVHIVLKNNGIPLFEFVTLKEDISELFKEKLTNGEFLYLSEFNTALSMASTRRGAHHKPLKYGFKPSVETFLNDPSGFFKYRLGISGWTSYHPWKGGTFAAAISTFPLNNIETANEPLSIPVRSDIVDYKKNKFVLSRLMFDQVRRLTPEIYGKFSAGLLEVQYAGIDLEAAMPVLDGRLFLGVSGSTVKKRDPDNILSVKNDDVKDVYTTAFFNMRLNIPELNAAVDIKAGRFLAGDDGARITVSKNINGIRLWAWYSITNTSVFNDAYNEGYHDKGIGISIPIRLFKGTDSRTSYSYALAPWTRDTGQDIYHFNNLFDIIGRNMKIFLDTDREMMY